MSRNSITDEENHLLRNCKNEKISQISLDDIQEFKNHPFKVRDDEQMKELVESVQHNGILIPVMIRPHPSGRGYEMISGHRRMYAAKQCNKKSIKAIVRELSDDQATILMVDSNIQRERILPSERGYAYKMKLEAMKHQGKSLEKTSMQVAQKYKGKWSVDILSEQVGESKYQIRRYIRLTELIKPLRDMVDDLRKDKKKIAFNPAVELSYLSLDNQKQVVELIEELDLTPSHSQAIRMKELQKRNMLDDETIFSIMTEEKPNQKDKLKLDLEKISKYFPRGTTPKDMMEYIEMLLEENSYDNEIRKENTDLKL